ncbi:hypothetical protein GM418_00430 [Maribellus comscasis]|uniref:Uncharacterized protein n=1 Tax=Maribellus comscasis TaxID=2681766 RepID=A0A6I6JPL8_9BACT|nr:hypothetical protein [Maribellus comscasis]QGY42172.1 hypothetical protein GM418_00430 [Maribellus comscasis]
MTRTEYLDTINGQRYERFKRIIKTVRLVVNQEPKGKNSSNEEKRIFRSEIRKQLKEQNRRAFRSDIILEIDYFTTKDNPPAIQTLSKNYLDLLHKEMPHIDSLKGILYKDDSQIKILICNYHIDEKSSKTPSIELKVCNLRYFLADIELAQKIIRNDFTDSDYSLESKFEEKLEEERYYNNKDYFEELKDLEEGKNDYDKLFGKRYYKMQKSFLIRQIQEQFLKQNNLDIRSLISVFQPYFSNNKKYFSNSDFQSIWNGSRNLISFSPAYLHFGNAPQVSGEKSIFKTNLKKELQVFKEKFKVLFPLLHPISVIVTFVPPKQKIIDLDNLARYIVPFVNEIFNPPTIVQLTYKDSYFTDLLKNEYEITQRFPPNSIASYQLVQLPRLKNDPQNGKIGFLITDGFYHMNNVWRTVDEIIYKWEDCL